MTATARPAYGPVVAPRGEAVPHLTPADRAGLLHRVLGCYDARLKDFPAQLQPDLIRSYLPDDINSPGLLSLAALPFWIGERLELPFDACLDAAVGNLFLLHCFQSFDFIVDQDRPETDFRHQVVLGGLCYQEVLRYYQPRLSGHPLFWERLPVYWREWGESLLWELEPAEGRRPFAKEQMFIAAHKAAALKLCPTALALQAGRADLVPAYEAAIDWMHAAMQLLDDLQDWQEDLQHRRFNAFLGLLVANGALAGDEMPPLADIIDSIHTTRVVEQYLELVDEFSDQGCTAIDALEIPAWSRLVAGLAAQGWWLAGWMRQATNDDPQ